MAMLAANELETAPSSCVLHTSTTDGQTSVQLTLRHPQHSNLLAQAVFTLQE